MSGNLGALPDIEECRVGDYVLQGTIGQGFFAQVKLAHHIPTGKHVAVKVISRQGCSEELEEVHILKSLNHPNIIQLFEVITTDNKVYLFMEYVAGGTLYDHLVDHGRMTEAEARPLFRQLTSAVQYCHQRGIVHRDLKPENILLDSGMTIKVADFGLSAEFTDENLTTFCGSVTYMAPEAVQRQPYYGPKVDVWSLGVILFRMLTRGLPFLGINLEDTKKQIVSGDFFVTYFVSPECHNLLKKLLTVSPSKRPTLEEIMKDPWVNMGEEEQLRPYIEPPWGDLDPQVTDMMKNLGFDPEEVQDTFTERTFNKIMGTYRILASTKNKMKGRTIRVRPCPTADPTSSATSSQEALPSGHSNKDPAGGRTSLGAKRPTLPPIEEEKNSTPSTSSEAGTTSPPLGPESTTATPGPALQHGPGDTYTTSSSSYPTSSPGAEGVAHETCLQAGHLDDEVPASSPGHSTSWQKLARRVIGFFLKCTCLRPSTRKHLKRNKVKPA